MVEEIVGESPPTALVEWVGARARGNPLFVGGLVRALLEEGADLRAPELRRLPEELIGLTVWKANPVVLDILGSAGALVADEKVQHSYPHCWRCHNPTIFRATEQWFIGMDRNNLRQRALDAIRKVKWLPSWGEERISNMIASRPDWCISRQRIWGVPIVAFYCAKCAEPIADRKYLDPIVAEFAIHTADIWYSRTAAELLPPDARCAK